MNCSQCQDVLVEYSLGELDRSATDEVARHLADGCASCGRELSEVEDVLAMLGSSLAPIAVPPHVKQDLLARVRSDGAGGSGTAPQLADPATATIPFTTTTRPRSFMRRVLPYAAAILCGFTVGALATQYFADNDFAAAARQARLDELLESSRKNLGSPQVHFAALHATHDEDEVVGHLMWDARGRSLHFFAFDVEPPAPGHALVVWFEISSGKAIEVGELEVSQRGACSAAFEAPQVDDEVTAIVVTEESDDDLAAPQGPQRIYARFGSPTAEAK